MTDHTHSNESCCCSDVATNRRFADSLRQKVREFLTSGSKEAARALTRSGSGDSSTGE
ncbi:MAG: hypothetical protein AB7W16_17375 [Candidatus Obscuribacterales bacterium]